MKKILKATGLTALYLLVLINAPQPAIVHADPPAANVVLEYCKNKKVVPKKAQGGCTTDNIQSALTLATWHCDGNASASDQATCLNDKAEGFIKKAADSSPKPASAKAFSTALNKVFKAAGGSTNTPDPSFGTSQNPAPCAPGDTPDTNGLCPTCTAKSTNSNCVCTATSCADNAVTCSSNGGCDLIEKYLNPGIDLFSVMFGLIAAGSLIMGGISYSASEGDPQKSSRAKSRITNTIFAIVAYMFLFSFLQFIIPGGAFNR